MLYAPVAAKLEVRAESDGTRVITGSFPYNSLATLSDGGRNGGRPRKERFKSHAFRHSVQSEEQDVALLFGHDFDKILASQKSESLTLTDTPEALTFEARVSPEVADTSHGKDALALIGAGLAVGISPGFRIPPQRTVPDAVEMTEEDPSEGLAIIRNIHQAILYELSIVARPAYDDSQLEARSWAMMRTVAGPRGGFFL